jgi:hypothetical protein
MKNLLGKRTKREGESENSIEKVNSSIVKEKRKYME